MNMWAELKKLLNEKKVIKKETVFNHFLNNFHTINLYTQLLEDAGLIECFREILSEEYMFTIPYYKILYVIPEKLTIADARKIKNNPWFLWFKFPDAEKIDNLTYSTFLPIRGYPAMTIKVTTTLQD